MLTVEQGLSKNVMYPLLLEDGSSRYFTKDGVIAYKEKLDKKLKKYGILNAIKWGFFALCVSYILFYLVFCLIYSRSVTDWNAYRTTVQYMNLPNIFLVPAIINIPRIHVISEHHMFLFKRFKETYGKYFTLGKCWNKINMKCDGGILGIQSLMNDIELRQY
jgi:hypothetical protein